MKAIEWRRFAPFGLYLSLLAALAALLLYFLQREWNLYLQISLGLVLVGLALFAILDPERVRVALTGRQARYGSNALVMALAFFGILVVVNYLAYQNSKRWDLTEDQQNTLTQETLDTLDSLPQEVEAQAFFTRRASSDQARRLLEQYKFNAEGNFDYRFIDPEADPVAAQQANIEQDGTIVLQMGDRQEPVTFANERELTASLVRLMSQEEVGVYFLTGHGERNPDETGEQAYSQVKSTLESKNYKVEVLNLLAANEIPEDARVIVIAGPRQPVSSQEVEQLQTFLSNGGALIVMEEPLLLTEFGEDADPLADYLAETWGVTLGRDLVVDVTSQPPTFAVANEYGQHPITEKLQGLVTFFPTARSVQPSNDTQAYTHTTLVTTSTNSWGETDFEALQSQDQQIGPDEGEDLMGPVPLVVAAEGTAGNQRLVVFGDADFAIDANFDQYGNGDLLINAIDWASEQENLINLTPRTPTQRVLLPPQRFTTGLLFLGSVVFLPGLMLVAGVYVFIQRRRRG